MRRWRGLLGVFLVAVLMVPALPSRGEACHACVEGEPCQGCPHEDPAFLILILTPTEGTAAQWLVRARVRPSLEASLLPLTRLIGRVRCTGPACPGRHAQFGGRIGPGAALDGLARFRSGAQCTFSGPLAFDPPSVAYDCTSRAGTPALHGIAKVTLCRGVGCPGT